MPRLAVCSAFSLDSFLVSGPAFPPFRLPLSPLIQTRSQHRDNVIDASVEQAVVCFIVHAHGVRGPDVWWDGRQKTICF